MRRLTPLLVLLALAACDAPDPAPTAPAEARAPRTDRDVSLSASSLDRHLVLAGPRGLPADFAERVARAGGRVVGSHDIGLAVVAGLGERGARDLEAVRGVELVVPDEAYPLGLPGGARVEGVPALADAPDLAPLFPLQWNLRVVGADAAWATGRLGSPGVTVAVLDTGVDYLLPDLVGLVDVGRSTSFIAADDLITAALFPGRELVTDLHWHGTHVAATVASNATLLAGVTSKTTLMGVKVCSVVDFRCPAGSVLLGILHAVDQGADVINMSLGGAFSKAAQGRFVALINRVLTYAHRAGVTVVVSAGNDGLDLDHDGNVFKTYCDAPNTICVAATGPASGGLFGPWDDIDAPTGYTNFGRSTIDVAAPGGTLDTPVIAGCSTTSLVFPFCQTGIGIVFATGTSMAAPHVSALAALLVEDFGRNPARIKAAILNGAVDRGQPGVDPFYGRGRVDIPASLGLD